MAGHEKINLLAIVFVGFHVICALTEKTVGASCESGNYETTPPECVSDVFLLQTRMNIVNHFVAPAPEDTIALTEQTASRRAAREAALWGEVDVAPWPEKIVLIVREALRQRGARNFDPFIVDGDSIVDLHPPHGKPLEGNPSSDVPMLRQHGPSFVDASLITDLHPAQGNPHGGYPSANISRLRRNAPFVLHNGSVVDLYTPYGDPLVGDPSKIPMMMSKQYLGQTDDFSLKHLWPKTGTWPKQTDTSYRSGDEGLNFFNKAPPMDWWILLISCVGLFLFDYFVIQRYMSESFRSHIGALCIWIFLAVVFNLIVWFRMGSNAAVEWCSGYLLEWMLSLDNLFVFHLIVAAFKTPKTQIHKAVFVGIIGAVVMRMVFFMVVSTILHVMHWIRFPFGLLLVWSGIEAARADDDEDLDAEDTRLLFVFRWILGDLLHEKYDESDVGAMFVYTDQGRLQVSMLLVVTACLEVSDIMFAVDSVSAKLAQIPDAYIAFSSSAIAMYGLRAMFFIVKDLIVMFDLLKYGICLILVFIGIELMLANYIHLSSTTVLIAIGAVFIVSICGSYAKKHLTPP